MNTTIIMHTVIIVNTVVITKTIMIVNTMVTNTIMIIKTPRIMNTVMITNCYDRDTKDEDKHNSTLEYKRQNISESYNNSNDACRNGFESCPCLRAVTPSTPSPVSQTTRT